MTRLEFFEADITPRSFLTKDEITKRDIARFGPKVRISKDILNAPITYRVKDKFDKTWQQENRPQRTVIRSRTVGEIALKTIKTKQEIEESLIAVKKMIENFGSASDELKASVTAVIKGQVGIPLIELLRKDFRFWHWLRQLMESIDWTKDWEKAGLKRPTFTRTKFKRNYRQIMPLIINHFDEVQLSSTGTMVDVVGPLTINKPIYDPILLDEGFDYEPTAIQDSLLPWVTSIDDDRKLGHFDVRYNAIVPPGFQIKEGFINEEDDDIEFLEEEEFDEEIEEGEGEIEEGELDLPLLPARVLKARRKKPKLFRQYLEAIESGILRGQFIRRIINERITTAEELNALRDAGRIRIIE